MWKREREREREKGGKETEMARDRGLPSATDIVGECVCEGKNCERKNL